VRERAWPPLRQSRASRRSLRRTVAALIAGALLPGAVAAAQGLQPAMLVAASASVVRVEADRAQGGLSIGSGVTVAPSVVVTNCHVTRDASTIRISGAGSVSAVTGQYADGVHDLCFLLVPGWTGRPVLLGAREPLQLGQAVAAIGFTGGTSKTFRLGRVQALHALEGGRVIESDTAFTSGASGGGLFDASGTLVGLLTFRLRGASGSYYSLPVRWIRERLPADDQWSDIHPLPEAMPFWQRDAATLPYFMRAAPLHAEGRWVELVELTERWSAADPRDAEPLRVRGEALRKLDRPGAAIGAYRAAVALGPEVPAAWYGLALAYAAVGNSAASMNAGARLADLDRDLAAALREEVDRMGASP
jgi:serine protease Do